MAEVKKKKSVKKKSKKKRSVARRKGALVIVESPAKCRTIEKILGKGFDVRASMGHIIDLPKSKMGVDIENDFDPKYIVMVAKRKTLKQLKQLANKRATLYLACDPDREGEAISWHLGNELGADMDVKRIRFHEITPKAIKQAFESPVQIDMNKIGAQQARRILDRIVGYSLSPLLWKNVAKGLSAGRVQSVALRLVVDQERKIKAFNPQEYWSIDARFQQSVGGNEQFSAALDQCDGQKLDISAEAEAKRIASEIRGADFHVAAIKSSTKRRQPQPPFTTSKLQQEAYNKLKLRPARTMSIAQSLYEGVDIGGEAVGLITYMRTDSVAVSEAALAEVREFIPSKYGSEYLPEKVNVYKSKKAAQEAHEAIRPTSVLRTPESLSSTLTDDQMKLYSLIWSRFVASQMLPAQIEQTSAEIKSGRYTFRTSGSRLLFHGFLKALEDREVSEGKYLPKLEKGEKLNLIELVENQHFTKPPPRYTEASLVKTLEELGIGRPSTYAPTIHTIVDRNYVERHGGSLIPTELGYLVVDLLVKHFGHLMNAQFTADMEGQLDLIEEGGENWKEVLRKFYNSFAEDLKKASDSIEPVRSQAESTDEICELCQKPMVIKWGRRGKFLSCSGFPECRNAKSIPTKIKCPGCAQGMLVARKSKSGRGRKFYGCTKYPDCTFITNKLPSENASETPKNQTLDTQSSG